MAKIMRLNLSPGDDTMRMEVCRDLNDQENYIGVDVSSWHQRNVYKVHEDKVQITLWNLPGPQTQFTAFPRTGNCPPLDKVEAKVREALEALLTSRTIQAERAAKRAEAERLADLECPLPPASGVWRQRAEDGRYEVKFSAFGLPAEAVRQIIEIEKTGAPLPPPSVQLTQDAVLNPAPREPRSRRQKTAATTGPYVPEFNTAG